MTVELSTLANGLRVVTHTMPQLETASLGIWVDAGARSERAENNGVAHFLEHMAFKGTTSRDARAIAEEIEDVGGYLNAQTGVESTAYYARILKGDVELAVRLLADILRDSVLAEEEIERERDVILQEIASVNDTPDDLVHDVALATAFPDQPLGRPILGTEASVEAMTRETLSGFLAEQYAPTGMVLSAAGAVEHGALVALAEGLLGDLPARKAPEASPGRYVGGGRSIERDSEQAQVILALEAPGVLAPDYIALQVLSGLLGGGISSRLFQEVREKRGLCYSIYTYQLGCRDCGLLGVHAGTRGDQVAELQDVVVEQIVDLAHTGPGEAELARAKAQLRAGLAMSLESSSSRADQLAHHIQMLGRVLGLEELVSQVEAVTVADVRDLVGRLVLAGEPTWVQMGPELPQHEQGALVDGLAGRRTPARPGAGRAKRRAG